jgi:hypothetical protein
VAGAHEAVDYRKTSSAGIAAASGPAR